MSGDLRDLANLVDLLAGRRVIVVGDVVLDEYLVGRPARVSREAPVIVLEFSRRFCRPGGAGNPAVNVVTLGSEAVLVSRIGSDEAGRTLRHELARCGLSDAGLVEAGERTFAKTRLLAEDGASRQHVSRLDYVPHPLSQPERKLIRERLTLAVTSRSARASTPALLISDYKGGIVDAELVAFARELGREHGLLTTVDSQGDLGLFSGLDLVKCNLQEAETAAGFPINGDGDVTRAGCLLIERLNCRFVVITRGAEGLSVFERGKPHAHIRATNRTEVFDVTGAGDTVIAVLTLGLLAGAPIVQAANLANVAAGLVVRKLGAATVTAADLRQSLLRV
jgi:rfaE bifunctional protein kinase chain/domain